MILNEPFFRRIVNENNGCLPVHGDTTGLELVTAVTTGGLRTGSGRSLSASYRNVEVREKVEIQSDTV